MPVLAETANLRAHLRRVAAAALERAIALSGGEIDNERAAAIRTALAERADALAALEAIAPNRLETR